MSTPENPSSAKAEATTEEHSSQPKGPLAALSLGALGVVYGDIGTSPLYALRECFLGHYPLPINEENILGVLSLMVWALICVISIKYLTFVMRADNHGEGGILALLSLTKAGVAEKGAPRSRVALLLLGLFGAALLYGEGVITPAISVLSAVEGLSIATPAFEPFILPITVVILIGLFSVQSRGTAGIASIFGPIMLVWFATLGVLGILKILDQSPDHLSVLGALNPLWGAHFLMEQGRLGFLVLGSVVLVITGGEALYADMGHFGAKPIRTAWYTVVLPGLLLNYLGQGALLLENGTDVRNPFFEMAPAWGLYPLVVLSTAAAIIASQALISGAFSLTQAAVQLGYAPRFTIVHTSGEAEGQIFIPPVNRVLMILCICLVLGFQESSELAEAYGMTVMGTMTITSLIFYAVARERWGWARLRAGLLVAFFLVFDLVFLSANVVKFFEGAWFPLAVGALLFAIMTTWKRGHEEVRRANGGAGLSLDLFLGDVAATHPHRVAGTALVMTSNPTGTPAVLLHHLKHNKTLHDRVILLSFVTERRPEVRGEDKVTIEELSEGFVRIVVRIGFMERPRMEWVAALCRTRGCEIDLLNTTFFLGRESIFSTGHSGMALWRKRLFVFLMRNAPTASDYFGLPPNRVVELGAQVEI
ncbi:MAG: potassium transporter Kup [Deltaproteobacteria bacterium]